MSAATAGITLPRITGSQPFIATRDHTCQSPWSCSGIPKGAPGAYLGAVDASGAEGLLMVCVDCATYLPPEPRPDQAADQTAPEAPEQPDGPMPSDAFVPELEPGTGPLTAQQLATGRPGEPLCPPMCRADRAGFRNDGTATEQRWVHTTCGLPAYAGQGAAALANGQAIGSPAVAVTPEDDGPAATPHQPDPAEGADESAGDPPAVVQDAPSAQVNESPLVDESAGDQPGALPHDAVKTCDCKRVSSKATFRAGPDGPVHDHCGGLVRDKHRHLVPDEMLATSTNAQEGPTDDGPDAGDPGEQPAAGAAGDRAGPGLEAGPADGAAGAGEGGGDSGEGARGGGLGGDQGRGGAAGPAGHGDDPAQPAREEGLEVRSAGDVAAQLEGPQAGTARGLGEVGGAVDGVAPRPSGLTATGDPAQALGGLAAFFAQPADEDDVPAPLTSLDWSLLADETPELSIEDEAVLQAVWSVEQLGGRTVALIAVGMDGVERRITVPR